MLSPRNAQGMALSGFLLAARGANEEAVSAFGRAIELDGALGNAWLGRGLMMIRAGDAVAGRDDLQIAATLEPNRVYPVHGLDRSAPLHGYSDFRKILLHFPE